MKRHLKSTRRVSSRAEATRRQSWLGLRCGLFALLVLSGVGAFLLVQSRHVSPTRPPSDSPPQPQDARFVVPTTVRVTTVSALDEATRSILDELIADFPDSADAYHVLGRFEASVHRMDAAQRAWETCIRLAPKHTFAYEGLAKIALDAGEHEAVSATLAEAITHGCFTAKIFETRATALVQLREFDEAIEVLEDGLKRFPRSASGWLLLGQTRMQRAEFEQAEADLRQAIRLAPRSADVHYALATACQRQGKHSEAAELRARFVELKTGDYAAHDQKLAVADLEHMRQKAAIAFCGAANCYYQHRDFLQAEQLLMHAVEIAPSLPESYRLLAALFRQLERLNDAITAQAQLAKLEASNVMNYLNLASLASEQGDVPQAISAIETALSLEPDNPLARRYLSQLTGQSGQAEPARSRIDRAQSPAYRSP